MNILITGGSGFVGQHLTRKLRAAGHDVTVLDRNHPRHVPDNTRFINLDLLTEDLPLDVVRDHDAVIHLMGVSVFQRWTKRRLQAMHDSRVLSGQKLVKVMLEVDGRRRPTVFITASAVGYYGNSGKAAVDETAEPGDDDLAKMCVDWEAILDPLKATNVRTAAIRTGIVIGRGGLLAFLRPLFKAYLGAIVGNGSQLISWISLDDLVAVYQHAVEDDRYHGPINAVAPKPVSMRKLSDKFAAGLHRPRIWKVPAFMVRPFYGSFANVVSFSQNVKPTKLAANRYHYEIPDFDAALYAALNDGDG